ncbi:MAG: hypothetical protein M0R50_03200 [Candidatus Cloacimonetes bacterium]|nr:hypothetical protein [Candidatus Cloacimonadota bacterium]
MDKPQTNYDKYLNHQMDDQVEKFYSSLNEAFDGSVDESFAGENRRFIQGSNKDIVKSCLDRILHIGHITNATQVEQQAQNEWLNSDGARKAFPQGYDAFGKAVRAEYESMGKREAIKHGDWTPDEDEPPRAKDRFYEDRDEAFNRSISEALNGIAVPDGAAQPKIGVKMLEQALGAKTKSGMSLKEALKKAGITWHVAEPGSHVVVFINKNGDEKWRVEPMTLSDKKVFEDTMEALWSVALGKAPNAKELERDAAKQRAKELSDHKNEISGLVDQIIGKHTKTGQEEQ